MTAAEVALLQDALRALRDLKRKHRALFAGDLKVFRTIVRKAEARVFRLKPGPKANVQIAGAARERARGTPWAALYPRFVDGYARMTEFTQALAEAGFQKKVNTFLHRHPVLRRRWQRPTTDRKAQC